MAGEIVHIEYPATDPDRAQAFWSGLFGWQFGPSMSPEFEQAFGETGLRAFQRVAQYLGAQMAAGRLRRMHPMLAVQSLVGGVMLHVLIGPLLSPAMVDGPTGEDAVGQFTDLWLRGMRPETAQ